MCTRIAPLMFLLVAASAVTAADVPPAAVRVVTIEDRRTATPEAKQNNSAPFWENRLTLNLLFEVPSLDKARLDGNLQIKSATDDLGTPLKLKKMSFGIPQAGKMNELKLDSNASKSAGHNVYATTIEFDSPPRKASKLSLSGQFDVRGGGEEKAVTVEKLTNLIGKPIDDPALKAAGLTIEVVKASSGIVFFPKPGEKQVIGLKMTGDHAAITSMKIMDGNEEAAHESMTETAPIRIVYFSSKTALADNASLQIKLIIGEQTQAVPLELKDVPLP